MNPHTNLQVSVELLVREHEKLTFAFVPILTPLRVFEVTMEDNTRERNT